MLVNPKDFFPRFLAAAQVEPNPQRRVAQLVVLESVGCRQWGKAKPILGGGELCLEETAQALMGKVQVLAGDWDVVEVGAEWVETAPAQVPVGIVYVLLVGQRFLIRQAFLAMT
jgi:hypothetical protein